jgi:hypothetical protein
VRRASRKAWLVSTALAFLAGGLALGILAAGFLSGSNDPSALGGTAAPADVQTGPVAKQHRRHTLTTAGDAQQFKLIRPAGSSLTPPTISLSPGAPAASVGLAVGPDAARSILAGPAAASPSGSGPAKPSAVNVQSAFGTSGVTPSWTTQTTTPPNSNDLKAVAAIDNSHVWAAGANCTLLFSSNGTSWAKDTHVPAGCTSNLTGVDVLGASGPGWAVGSGGTVLVCASVCNAATATWTALSQAVIVGKNDGKLTNGSTAAQSNSLFTVDYSGYSITDSPNNKIPAATTISSTSLGTKTATLSHAATGTINNDTFTVTAPAAVLPPATVNFTAVWATDATHVYASGTIGASTGQIWACSANCGTSAVGIGSSTWTNVTPSGLTSTALNAVEGQGTNLVFAAGSNGKILVCAVATCNTLSTGWLGLTAGTGGSVPAGVTFNGVWASDANHVYAVGTNGSAGVIWACNANCNSATTGPSGVPSPPAAPPNPAAGKSAWANITPVADAISPFNLPPPLNSVSGIGPDSAWAVGTGGAIWYCPQACTTEPTSWVKLSPSSPTSSTLFGVTSADANHVWAVGLGGTIVAQINPNATATGAANAIGELGVALNPLVWGTPTDGNHLSLTQGDQFFAHAKNAAGDVMGINPSPPWEAPQLTSLDYAARLLATTAINDFTCGPNAKAKEVTAANNELATGDTEFGKQHYDAAIEHYGHAWDHALSAGGSSCAAGTPGITAIGTGFAVSNMAPGGSATTTFTVTVTGTPTSGTPPVALWESNVVDGGLLSGLKPLQLAVFEDASATPFFTGNLSQPTWNGTSGWLVLPGSGAGGAWAANESHTFKFVVSLPLLADNSYQTKNASLKFVFGRN